MKVTYGQAVQLLNLSFRSMPTSVREADLLVDLVETWLVQHGEAWVKANLLLEGEWLRQRATLLTRSAGRTIN
jgi:hypothetical protein